MSLFSFKITDLERLVQHLEVSELPLNFSKLIGEGSAAKVYKSFNKGEKLAVKLFKIQFAKKRILTVCNELRQLKHTNIVNFIGYSLRPSALCFELCCVKVHDTLVYSLKELVNIFNDNDYFNLKERTSYLIQACNGIMYLHEKNIIHRDIKPSNMLVSGSIENLTIKISDFGDMTTIKNTITSTFNNYLKGLTVCYEAPELLDLNPKLSMYTDIYALSISSFEILSNLCSPWENHLPIINDVFLLQALKNNERPDADLLSVLYKDNDKEIKIITKAIQLGWKSFPEERISLKNLLKEFHSTNERKKLVSFDPNKDLEDDKSYVKKNEDFLEKNKEIIILKKI
ncbi:uncharacterized protein LOC136080384 [Hydra vulgaris]|uniref:Uncharacterized protein LOC136080384 n=1 Tax=Hydra vulgaris TaxID=6087 RepID=A0ABM4BV52_HYDVU